MGGAGTGEPTKHALASRLVTLGLAIAFGAVGVPRASADEILVAAAASLREPVVTLAEVHETRHPGDRVRVSFGSSSSLALQIRHGAPVDVFLSADSRLVDTLVSEGLIGDDRHQPLVGNRLVVIRPRGSDLRVGAPSDLLDPRIRRFALPSEVVPLGGYGRRWLQERGLLDALGPRIVVTEHARATLAAVAQGHADAAIVYATDAATSPGVEVAWAIPDGEQPSILYAIATPGEGDVAPATERFVTLVQGPDGERILQSAGFVWRAKDPSVAAPIASGPRP